MRIVRPKVPGRTSTLLTLVIWLGALAIGQRLDRTLVEFDALSLANPELAAECARLQAKVELGPALRIELEKRKATLARWLAILPAPEIATHERLFERFLSCCEASGGFGPRCTGMKTAPTPPVWLGDFRELDITLGCEGTLPQFVRFLRELEREEFFVRVNAFRCSIDENSWDRRVNPVLRIAINVSTFRFVDRAR